MENTLRTRARQKHENKQTHKHKKHKKHKQKKKTKKKKAKKQKTRTISIFGEFHITRTTDEHFDRPAWS